MMMTVMTGMNKAQLLSRPIRQRRYTGHWWFWNLALAVASPAVLWAYLSNSTEWMAEEAKRRRLSQMEKAAAALRPEAAAPVVDTEVAPGDRVSQLEAKVEALEKVIQQVVLPAGGSEEARKVAPESEPKAPSSKAPPPPADGNWKEKVVDMSGIRRRVLEKELRAYERKGGPNEKP